MKIELESLIKNISIKDIKLDIFSSKEVNVDFYQLASPISMNISGNENVYIKDFCVMNPCKYTSEKEICFLRFLSPVKVTPKAFEHISVEVNELILLHGDHKAYVLDKNQDLQLSKYAPVIFKNINVIKLSNDDYIDVFLEGIFMSMSKNNTEQSIVTLNMLGEWDDNCTCGLEYQSNNQIILKINGMELFCERMVDDIGQHHSKTEFNKNQKVFLPYLNRLISASDAFFYPDKSYSVTNNEAFNVCIGKTGIELKPEDSLHFDSEQKLLSIWFEAPIDINNMMIRSLDFDPKSSEIHCRLGIDTKINLPNGIILSLKKWDVVYTDLNYQINNNKMMLRALGI